MCIRDRFEKILACDRLILAAPIFSMGICAQAKSFIDRSQQFWAYKYLLGKKLFDNSQRKGIFISCAGTKLPHVFDGALQAVSYTHLDVYKRQRYLFSSVQTYELYKSS